MSLDIPAIFGDRNEANCHEATAQIGFSERLARRRNQWDTGSFWQKQLFNKVAAKSFASDLGVPVPQVYWLGNSALALPELPSSFVIKPAHGHSGKGVVPVVDGINCLTNERFSWTDAQGAFGGKGGTLIEEYIHTTPNSREIVEYKVFVFGETCVVRVNHDHFDHRLHTIKTDWHSFFTERWERISQPINLYAPSGPDLPRPEQLDSLLEYARRLGKAYAAFVRVDFYLSPTSVMFGEFCPFPWNGQHFTEFGDRYFGVLWEQYLDDRI